jgi:hypothetical protein
MLALGNRKLRFEFIEESRRRGLGDVLGESGLDAVMSENAVKLLQLVVCRRARELNWRNRHNRHITTTFATITTTQQVGIC